MSEHRNNTFSMLVDEEISNVLADTSDYSQKRVSTDSVGNNGPQEPNLKRDSSDNSTGGLNNVTGNSSDDANWTVQQGTRSRRLAPQWTLKSADLGADTSKSKPSVSYPPGNNNINSNESQGTIQSNTVNTSSHKKKVVRFTKDELLQRRQRTAILSSMKALGDIISSIPLDPVAFNPLQADEIQKLWYSDRNKDNVKGVKKTQKRDDEAENAGIWDDGGGSLAAMGTLDLADISAAALKFQSETYNLSTLKDLLPNMEANHEEEEGELPEWARDDVIPAMNPVIPNESNEIRETKVTDLNSSKKKNLLMEALQINHPEKNSGPLSNLDSSMEPGKIDASMESTIADQMQSIEDIPLIHASRPGDSLLFSQFYQPLSQPIEVILPTTSDEWFYTDPSNVVQGPFTTENMKAWNDAGYFSPELPVKMKHWLTFHQLSTVFPIYMDAFSNQPIEPMETTFYQREQRLVEEQQLLLQAQQHQRALQLQEHERLLQAQAQEQQRLQEQSILEQYRLQQQQHQANLIERQRREAMEQRRQLELSEEARREQQRQLEERRNAIFLEAENKRNAVLLQDKMQREYEEQKKYQDQLLIEQQRQRQIEEQQRQRQLEEQQRQRQDLLAAQELQRRQQEHAAEKQRLELESTARRMEEQFRVEREQHNAFLEEQRRQHERYVQSLENNVTVKPTPVAPWANHVNHDETKTKESLLDIQRRELVEAERMAKQREQALREAANRTSGWMKPLVAQATNAKGLLDIQLEERRIREEKEASVRQNMANTSISSQSSVSTQLKSLLGVQGKGTTATGIWPAAQQSNSSLSLREIMEQEQASLASQSYQSESSAFSKAPVGSWAAKAMTGSPHPALNSSVKTTSRDPNYASSNQPKVSAPKSSANLTESPKSLWTMENASQRSISNKSQSSNDDGMPKDIAEWCESQLKRINNAADISLLHVCFSLSSAGEIREYLSEILGSTPAVSLFATEFIKRKELVTSNQNQSKKKKK